MQVEMVVTQQWIDLKVWSCKGGPNYTVCALEKQKRAFSLCIKSRGVSDEGQKVAPTSMFHTGVMTLQEVLYSLVAKDADLLLSESIKD